MMVRTLEVWRYVQEELDGDLYPDNDVAWVTEVGWSISTDECALMGMVLLVGFFFYIFEYIYIYMWFPKAAVGSVGLRWFVLNWKVGSGGVYSVGVSRFVREID